MGWDEPIFICVWFGVRWDRISTVEEYSMLMRDDSIPSNQPDGTGSSHFSIVHAVSMSSLPLPSSRRHPHRPTLLSFARQWEQRSSSQLVSVGTTETSTLLRSARTVGCSSPPGEGDLRTREHLHPPLKTDLHQQTCARSRACDGVVTWSKVAQDPDRKRFLQ